MTLETALSLLVILEAHFLSSNADSASEEYQAIRAVLLNWRRIPCNGGIFLEICKGVQRLSLVKMGYLADFIMI